jgi:hypothetical protein
LIEMKTPKYEPERIIEEPENGLTCHIYGHAPVQADGDWRGSPFYFRARWDHWSIVFSINPKVDPSTIWPQTNEPGRFQDGEFAGFYLDGDYGDAPEASWMQYSTAEKIIHDSVQRFHEAFPIDPPRTPNALMVRRSE